MARLSAPAGEVDRNVKRSREAAGLFAVSALFHYLGPAFAVLLFARVDRVGVAWLRIASAALVFAIWRRPWRAVRHLDRRGCALIAGWGAVLALMNVCFYEAIARLPLGTVGAIEFLPVIAIAALGMRTRRNMLALASASVGVFLLTNVRGRADSLGLGFAAASAALLALYIVLAHRVARRPGLAGIDGLGAAMLVATVVVTPLGGRSALSTLSDPVAVAAAFGVGLCSSVIPYVTDQMAMARVDRATYALMFSILPAVAFLIGAVVLGQIPTATEVLAVGLVIGGVAIHRAPVVREGDEREPSRSSSE